MSMEPTKKIVMVGLDDSKESFYSLEWTLDHLLTPTSTTFKLLLIHVKPQPLSVLRFAGPGTLLIMPPSWNNLT